ncbi:MAG TPA: beta/gamma crystallin domain-containing protein [Thermoanaerobaculia bacterium]|nr:beta/gamma crystallin domain-containing protein [Thermoanaerobaculia bacterium]
MKRIVLAVAVLAATVSCTVVKSQPAPVITTGTAASSGCWAHIWEGPNFAGRNNRIDGPGRWVNVGDLPGADRKDWNDRINSVEVGPSATVTFWKHDNFRGDSIRLLAGERRATLDGRPDMAGAISSLEISCR